MFLVVLFVTSVFGDLEPTTTKTYDIEVPGSDPIRIIEGEPLWPTTSTSVTKSGESEHRSFNNNRGSTEDSNDPLHQFLTSYADTVRRNKNKNKDEQLMETDKLIKLDESSDKSKSWDLMQHQKHNHPYDDKKGWISMEPVPWSVSKISKWQSNYKPSNPKPWEDYDSSETQSVRPSWSKPPNNYDLSESLPLRPSSTIKPLNNYDIYYLEHKPDSKPMFSKPTALYNQKVHVDYNKYQHKHNENCKHTPQRPPVDDPEEIITDGLPANFPQTYEANRRRGTDIHPDTHPLSGDGEWVLLSTTKGYKYPPERQRSLRINPESIGAHRGVRLTVLPPLKNSKVNMTTSHGGLLQVESTFQTVEQSRKQFNKKQKLKKKKIQKRKPVRQVAAPAAVTTTRRNSQHDSSAVLAAVGAGMIPATMAMLVPMALGGRRKRETSTPKYLELTLPRNL